ncbi:DNA primase [Xylocopilactobacillus apicola]|uniref:DNA primase n=1 Tax=Xylocopilactobacillus apicola TaxID=2932184 RepID=A0AAU9DX15_9LACO|nr:DNA primase [Xylocopilactobacillus apicola]BDR58623.1 DNA primase [Xylocopilactobacillus apicola]
MAQRIPTEIINDIQQRASIVDVIGQYVQLKKQGANYFGLCPFQNEKTPSFSVSEDKKIFHCFSCGRGGSVFSFMMMIDNLNFVEAVAKVAQISGIPFDSYRYQTHSSKERINEPVTKVLSFARDFYHHILEHTELGRPALDYLEQRQIEKETIEHFRLGYAPDNNLLAESLQQNNDFNTQSILESNIVSGTDSDLYDYFKDRLMIPITDDSGNIVGFGGRALHQQDIKEPRYLNSKQSDVFNKGNLLFNLSAAKQEISLVHEVILLEGYFDVISAWQAGVKNIVASMGTSFTKHQLGLLNKVANRVVLVYDGDDAGKAAIDKAIDNLNNQHNLEVLVAPIPGGLDPDEYIKKYGSDSFKKLVNKDRVSKYRFRLDYYQEGIDLKNEQELLKFIDRILNKFVDLKDDLVQKELYLKELAQISGISLLNLQNQFNQHVVKKQGKTRIIRSLEDSPRTKIDNKFERAQQEILFLIFNNNISDWLNQKYNWVFPNTDYQIIYELFSQYYHKNQGDIHFYEFLNELPPELSNIATSVNSLNRPVKTDEKEISELINVIKKEELETKIFRTKLKIEEYEKLGQKEKLNQSVKELIELIRLKQQEVS